MFQRLWADEVGAVVSSELVLVLTIIVLGAIVGITTVRDQVIQELGDVAAAFAGSNQAFSFSGITGHHSSTAGSIFVDTLDDCQGVISDDPQGQAPLCIAVALPPTPEG